LVVDHAIITIPTHFEQPQHDASLQAAINAGLTVVQLLNEPTAAIMYNKQVWDSN